jgi:hypothetical protein
VAAAVAAGLQADRFRGLLSLSPLYLSLGGARLTYSRFIIL